MIKFTPWFHGSVKPVRRGVYERQPSYSTDPYSYWTGKYWAITDRTPEKADDPIWRQYKSGLQDLPWRGLTKRGIK